MKRQRLSLGLRPNFGKDPYFGLVLVAPLLVWVMAMVLVPFAEALLLSFKNVGYAGTQGRFVGLKNYLNLLRSPGFARSLVTTAVWTTLNVALQMGLALAAAVILNQDFFGKGFIRSWVIMPWVLPSIVLATLGKWVLDPTLGVVNYILRATGLVARPVPFLSVPRLALASVTLVNVWRWFPFFAVVLLAALQTVPKELYEAAEIDRAGPLQKFRYVELPAIAPVLKVQTLMCSLWAANIFDTIWLLTRGGPGYATNTLPIAVYMKAYQEFRTSQASAMAIIFSAMLILLSLVYFRQWVSQEWAE